MSKIINLTEENFQKEVLDSNELVVVDFWAEWCGPCKMLGPVLEVIAEEVTTKICKVNVDAVPTLANKYKIRSIPTILFFKNGEVISNLIGFDSKETILKKIEELR